MLSEEKFKVLVVAENLGYKHGREDQSEQNPYPEGSDEWDAYNAGYEAGSWGANV